MVCSSLLIRIRSLTGRIVLQSSLDQLFYSLTLIILGRTFSILLGVLNMILLHTQRMSA